MRLRFTQSARRQQRSILTRSKRLHGKQAAQRYDLLILTALRHLVDHHPAPGALVLGNVPDVWAFPIELVRASLAPAQRVRNPQHLIIYRATAEEIVVLAMPHRRMRLEVAARRALRNPDET